MAAIQCMRRGEAFSKKIMPGPVSPALKPAKGPEVPDAPIAAQCPSTPSIGAAAPKQPRAAEKADRAKKPQPPGGKRGAVQQPVSQKPSAGPLLSSSLGHGGVGCVPLVNAEALPAGAQDKVRQMKNLIYAPTHPSYRAAPHTLGHPMSPEEQDGVWTVLPYVMRDTKLWRPIVPLLHTKDPGTDTEELRLVYAIYGSDSASKGRYDIMYNLDADNSAALAANLAYVPLDGACAPEKLDYQVRYLLDCLIQRFGWSGAASAKDLAAGRLVVPDSTPALQHLTGHLRNHNRTGKHTGGDEASLLVLGGLSSSAQEAHNSSARLVQNEMFARGCDAMPALPGFLLSVGQCQSGSFENKPPPPARVDPPKAEKSAQKKRAAEEGRGSASAAKKRRRADEESEPSMSGSGSDNGSGSDSSEEESEEQDDDDESVGSAESEEEEEEERPVRPKKAPVAEASSADKAKGGAQSALPSDEQEAGLAAEPPQRTRRPAMKLRLKNTLVGTQAFNYIDQLEHLIPAKHSEAFAAAFAKAKEAKTTYEVDGKVETALGVVKALFSFINVLARVVAALGQAESPQPVDVMATREFAKQMATIYMEDDESLRSVDESLHTCLTTLQAAMARRAGAVRQAERSVLKLLELKP